MTKETDPYQGHTALQQGQDGNLFVQEPSDTLTSSSQPLPLEAGQRSANRGPDPPMTSTSAPRSARSPAKQQQQPTTRAAATSPTRIQSPLRQSVSSTSLNDHGCSPTSTLRSNTRHKHRHHPPRADPTKVSTGSPTMSFTGDGRVPSRGWFNQGGASPVSTHSQAATPTQSQPFPAPVGKSSSTQRNVSSSSTSSVFSMFKSHRASAAARAGPNDEELLTMDFDKALFPSGMPSEQDAFSPAAFKNLQMNATGLLRKFQSAYQHRADEARELRAEAADAAEDSDARMNHLKMQLEAMAQKAAEHEAVMHALMEELNIEKKLRLSNAKEMTQGVGCYESVSGSAPAAVSSSAVSTMSEDLYAEEDQKKLRAWRRSAATIKSDLSFDDTDEESVEEISVFSRSRSPTIATTVSDMDSMPPPPVPAKPTMMAVHPRTSRPPTVMNPQPPTAQMSALQRLWKGMSSPDAESKFLAGGSSRCRNCQGQDASVAWDTVGLLRDENKGLKQRVGDLETAVEGALDAVNGISMDF